MQTIDQLLSEPEIAGADATTTFSEKVLQDCIWQLQAVFDPLPVAVRIQRNDLKRGTTLLGQILQHLRERQMVAGYAELLRRLHISHACDMAISLSDPPDEVKVSTFGDLLKTVAGCHTDDVITATATDGIIEVKIEGGEHPDRRSVYFWIPIAQIFTR